MRQLRKSRHGQLTSINSRVARNINRAIVLNLIHERQPIPRATISKVTGLNKSTVSNIVKGLMTEDLVTERLSRNRDIGRHPFDLRVQTGKHFVGAIYIDSSKTMPAVVDIDGVVKASTEIKTDAQRPQEFLSQCVRSVEGPSAEAHAHGLRGIGITVAGIVDSTHSKVHYAPDLGWENVDIGHMIRAYAPKIGPSLLKTTRKRLHSQNSCLNSTE